MRSGGKVVVVHRGARDGYQAAAALAESGNLERLVTDLWWPGDRRGTQTAAALLPGSFSRLLAQRTHALVARSQVKCCPVSGLFSLGTEKIRQVPFAWRQRATRWVDASLGRAAGELATRTGAALLSYSYYAHSAFGNYRGAAPRLLFQLHPHPASMRRLLMTELEAHPDCAVSLSKEWELSLPEADYRQLVDETAMADYWLVASSFTASTLKEAGIPPERIEVIPYGVDLDRFRPDRTTASSTHRPLQLLFVGTINQRKGIKYLLEALRLFRPDQVKLTVCGRVVDDLSLFRPFGTQVDVRPNVSSPELAAAYAAADLFVFPSIAEGFGHVLLEALASGLPVLSTTNTAAPDLIANGEQGFVVPPRSPAALADKISWALDHRWSLHRMRVAARHTAEAFTWARFREGVRAAVSRGLDRNPIRDGALSGVLHV